MSISDQEIWACANEVIRRYGDGASVHATQRADELLAKSDIAGQRTWLGILHWHRTARERRTAVGAAQLMILVALPIPL